MGWPWPPTRWSGGVRCHAPAAAEPDRRAKRSYLTQKGRETAQPSRITLLEVERRIGRSLGTDKYQEMRRNLAAISEMDSIDRRRRNTQPEPDPPGRQDSGGIVPSGELDRLCETTEVLSGTELVRDLREGLADARAGRVLSAEEVAADLAARPAAGR